MKLTSHITCILAIMAQIFLSSVAFAHDVACQSSRISASESNNSPEQQYDDACGCCYNHATDNETSGNSVLVNDLPIPCTCSTAPISQFTAADYHVETRERKIALVPFTCDEHAQSFLHLQNITTLNSVLGTLCNDVGFNQWGMLIHLPQYSGRFVSTHLSKFLL